MKRFSLWATLLVAIVGASFMPMKTFAQSEATIDIDLTIPMGDTIKPYIYGGFIEFLGGCINPYTGYDRWGNESRTELGLWAQEIGYRGFDVGDSAKPGISKRWYKIIQGNNFPVYSLDTIRYNQRGIYSQKIEITSYTDGRSGIGYLPVCIESGKAYEIYLYLKGSEISGGVTVWLIDDMYWFSGKWNFGLVK